jgi:lipoprotein signal peptidase
MVLVGVCLLIGIARVSGVLRGLGPASGLVIGGLLSNQIDRIRTGTVDDFIAAASLPSHPNAMDLADVAVGIGAATLIALVLISTLSPVGSDSRTRVATSSTRHHRRTDD